MRVSPLASAATPAAVLADVTAVLLDPAASPDALRAAIGDLHALCAEITGIRGDGVAAQAAASHTVLGNGLALSPVHAAQCLFFHRRTAVFLQGVERALRAAQRRFPGVRIEVVYAGCGPYAPLALPLMARFDPAEVVFTLLDIHPRALDAVRRLLDQLGLGAYVRACQEGDAAAYVHPPGLPLHVVITETMQQALAEEPQVAITRHLVPQLCAGGLLVPERIAVRACLVDLHHALPGDDPARRAPGFAPFGGRRGLDLGVVFELTAETARGPRRHPEAPTASGLPGLAPVALTIPPLSALGACLTLRTEIDVFGDIGLREEECVLTHAHPLGVIGPEEAGQMLVLGYGFGSAPGFWHRVQPPAR